MRVNVSQGQKNMAPIYKRQKTFGGVVAEPVAAYVPPPTFGVDVADAKKELGVKDAARRGGATYSHASAEPQKKVERPKASKVNSIRETLMLDPDDILALFDVPV